MILYLDLETYCETPITHGTHRYAEGAEIIVSAWAVDDEPVQVAEGCSDAMLRLAQDADTIVIHNSGFDRTVLRHNGIHIPPKIIHDTMVQAMSHGLPGSLDKLCGIMGVPVDQAKSKAGRALIQLFCKPSEQRKIRRATSATHPVEWSRFLEYARLDVEAMRVLYKRLPRVNYPAPREHALWCLDQRMNDRGFLVDTELAEAAIATVAKAKRTMDLRTQEMTDDAIRSTTQRDQVLRFVLAEHGIDLPDMQRSTLERRLADDSLPAGARDLLAMRLQTSTTSNAKYNSLLRSVSADGRLRGTMQFCGAPATKRFSGKVFQPTNLPRPDMTHEEIEDGIIAMKAGACDLLWDNPIKVASNAIRGCIISPPDRKLVVSDLEQIEARTLPWLAGEQWKLDAFAAHDRGEGPDLYRVAAGRILNKAPEDVTKDERQSHGKTTELSAGYGGALGAWKAMAATFGFELPSDAEIKEIVNAWRKAHPAIADWTDGFWVRLDEAARQAIACPNKAFEAGDHIRFERWREWLRMELPSGGFLNYAAPAVIPDERRPGADCVSYLGVNAYSRKWERITTYPGKWSAMATQATAREIICENLQHIEAAGYAPLIIVHDEVVTETPDELKYSVDNLSALLSRQPAWAEGLPLAADGFSDYRYRK